MAKAQLLDSIGSNLSLVDTVVSTVPKITSVKPIGSQVLIEILTPQELMGTSLTLSNKTEVKVALQGYIRAVGPCFRPDQWGFNVGDRVLISGSGVMAPNVNENHRESFLMEPHAVKSVLVEA